MECRYVLGQTTLFTEYYKSVVVKQATIEGISITECLLTRSVFQVAVMPLVSLCRNCLFVATNQENKVDAYKQDQLYEFLRA